MTASLKVKNDRYYAVINYKEGDDYKQKWIALGLPTKNNKRKAEAMLDEIKAEYEEKYSTPGGDVLFDVYVREWLERKKPFIELSTWEGYQIYAERHIIPYFKPLKLTLRNLRPQHIRDYYHYKFTNGRLDGKPGGLSIPSIKKHSIVIKEVLNDALVSELVIRNVAEGVKLPAKDVSTRERTFLTSDDANLVLKAFDKHPLQPLVYVTLYYGLRRSEVLGLRWSAVDFERGTLSVNHTVVNNRTIVMKDTTKTKSSYHTYRLIDDVRKVLLDQKARQEANRKEFSTSYIDSDYIFTREDGSLFRPDYVTRGFQNVLKKHGFPKMRFHDLRHSTASILHDKGWDLKDAQSWLRHSSVEMTGDIYTHIAESRKSKMAAELNSTFTIGS
jgi:integrase